jgi:glycosyltransferase involved in cell wall biosynthesis
MRIGLETSVLRTNRAGSAVYTRNLVTRLQALGSGHDFVLYAFGKARERAGRRPWETVIRDTVWMHVAVPLRVWHDRIDVFHATAFSAPVAVRCPLVLTVLDLATVKHPEWFDHRWFYFYTTLTLPFLATRADRIVTISEASKRELMAHYGLAAERIAIVPPAVDHALFHARQDPEAVRSVRARLGLPDRFILSVGTLEPRKNLSRLIEAFAIMRARAATDRLLVIAGDRGWQYEQIFRTVRSLGLEDTVRFLGYVPEPDLPLLYHAADLFVYPSLYEGFGVPILEAMACGCPVVCSNRSSMPEVIGEAGITVDPEDGEALAAAMERVLGDPAVADALRSRGLARAQRFRWEDSTRLLLGVYEDLARSASR